jgi:hypothetical protein
VALVVELILEIIDLVLVVAQLALQELAIRIAAASAEPKQSGAEREGQDLFHIRLMRKRARLGAIPQADGIPPPNPSAAKWTSGFRPRFDKLTAG